MTLMRGKLTLAGAAKTLGGVSVYSGKDVGRCVSVQRQRRWQVCQCTAANTLAGVSVQR